MQLLNRLRRYLRHLSATISTGRSQLVTDAKQLLEKNWSGSFTKPTDELYPHQWSWDSAFIALGYAHYNQERAEQELQRLFEGQWSNGMVPQIVYDDAAPGDTYFPYADFWGTDSLSVSPEKLRTSGICQPPVHATAVLHLLKNAKDYIRAKSFASGLFPSLKKWHDFLYSERDPHHEGLVYIRHPWSSGQDNSPIWDSILEQITVQPGQIPDYRRRDTDHVDTDQRPTDLDYDRYIYLIEFFRERNYNERQIREDGCPFMVQDVLFNTLLCRAGRDLAEVAKVIGEDPNPFISQAEQTAQSMNEKMWDEEHDTYIDIDMNSNRKIHAHVISGFLPLFARIPGSERAKRLFDYLNTSCFCRLSDTCFAAPSYDRSGKGYSSSKYWRGPIGINMNRLLYHGLLNYRYDFYTEKIKQSIIELPKMSGFHEYYDPDTGQGYGTDRFSWTVALFLDVHYGEQTDEHS